MMRIAVACFFLMLVLQASAQPLFTSLPSSATGITFQNKVQESSKNNVLAYEYFYNGGGVAVGDLNNDSLPDIVFTANTDQPSIYFNRGNFKFDNVTAQTKIKAPDWKTGVTLADVNADGWLDIYICRSGNNDESARSNLLFINQKNGTFKEMAAKYGIDDKGYSTHAAFFDFDNDGDLDLYVLNHPIKRLTRFDVAFMKQARDPFAGDKLYRNDGAKFTDVTLQAGISGNPISFGLGIAVADFNGDGWRDLYISNDYDEDDYLYLNQRNGTFRDSAAAYMKHTSKFSMGSDAADINNDGMTDLLTLDMLPEDNKRQKLLKGPDGYDHFQMLLRNGYGYQYMRNMMHVAMKNNDQIGFSEVGQLSGISNTDWSWSALFGDYDLDGWQDLFITNGYMRDYTSMDFLKYKAPEAFRLAREHGKEPDLYEIVKQMPASNVKNYLFHNKGNLQFENASTSWGMDLPSLSNGAAYGDFDNDGDWDLVVNNINQAAFIWQNHAEDLKNNFVKIRLKGPAGNSFGIGTKVRITGSNGFEQLQELQLVHGYQSSVEPCLIFGAGSRKEINIRVTWPDKREQILEAQPTHSSMSIDYKNATESKKENVVHQMIFTELVDSGGRFVHLEDEYNDFKREPLLPHQYSKNGPALATGDVNGDGKADFFAGGGKGQAGEIYINEGDGKFRKTSQPEIEQHLDFEDTKAYFADLDGDKDLDLYVVSGGNESNFEDRIYWNNGDGKFRYISGVLPPTTSSGGSVTIFDTDNDGDIDIFRGGQVETGAYPIAPRSYLFINDHGNFKDATPAFMKNIGMVNTSDAGDLNKDGILDLVIAGDYMPMTILFGQKEQPFFTAEKMQQIPQSTGWWNIVKIKDSNGDGYPDIIAGNDGLNSQLHPTPGQPVTVDAADIDNNGTMDCILSYYINGKSYPLPTRDELFDQVPSLKVKFPTYETYADATVENIMSSEQFAKAVHVKAEEFRSGIFINSGKTFSFAPFDMQAQAFPVRDIIEADFNHDGRNDLLMAGNNYAVRAQWGRYDAGKGLLLVKNKDNAYTCEQNTGFNADKDFRNMAMIGNYLIVANNNDKIQVFRIN